MKTPWRAAAFLSLALGAAALWAWSVHAVVFDDAYISYRYADNLVSGHGLVYNPGERVQGYTNFLWTLIAAAAIAVGQDPLEATRALGVASHVATVAAVAAVACRLWLSTSPLGWALLPSLAVMVAPPSFAAQAGSGLETSFMGLLMAAGGVVLFYGDPARRGTRALLAALLLVACLTRLDGLAAAGAAAIAIAGSALAAGATMRTALQRAASLVAPVGIGVAAFLAASAAYYGDWLPNTYYAKAADVPHLREGLAYLDAFVRSEPQSIPLALLAFVPLFARRDERRFRLALYAVVTLFVELVHIVRFGGDFMEYRLLWQLYGLLALGAVVGLASALEISRPAALVAAAAALAFAFQPAVLETAYGMQSLPEMDSYTRTGAVVGRRLAEVLPRDTVLATTLAGTIAYYSRRTVIDQWGLNDRFVAHLPYRQMTLVRGHVKSASEEYLRSRGVNLRIDHPMVCPCARLCRNGRPSVFVVLDADHCLRTSYDGPQPALTAHFCAHPEQFLLDEVRCPDRAQSSPPSSGFGSLYFATDLQFAAIPRDRAIEASARYANTSTLITANRASSRIARSR
jgi:arabinofuranosyltransferase